MEFLKATVPDIKIPKDFKDATSLEDQTSVLAKSLKEAVKPTPKSLHASSKEAVYASLDPVLALLYKEWKSAKRQYDMLIASGADPEDAMLDVAIDRLDASRFSFETRLLEVKADKELFTKAERLWENELNLEGDDEREAQEAEALRLKELEQQWQDFARAYGADTTPSRESNLAFFLFIAYVFFYHGGFNANGYAYPRYAHAL